MPGEDSVDDARLPGADQDHRCSPVAVLAGVHAEPRFQRSLSPLRCTALSYGTKEKSGCLRMGFLV